MLMIKYIWSFESTSTLLAPLGDFIIKTMINSIGLKVHDVYNILE